MLSKIALFIGILLFYLSSHLYDLNFLYLFEVCFHSFELVIANRVSPP
jgi:hypothetical protein